MVTCLERGADLHMAQLMPLQLIVSYFRKIQICFTFLVPAHQGSPGQRAIKRVCVYLITLHCNTVHKMCNQLTWCTARLHRSQNRMTFAFWHSPSMHIAHTASSSMEIDKPREGLSDDRVRKNASFSNLSIKASNISCTTGASDFPSRCSLANSNQM